MIDELTRAYQTGGRSSFLLRVADRFEKGVEHGAFPSYKIAHTFARLKNREKTIEWIEKCITERSPNIIKISVDPNFEFLQDDSRFRSALAQLKLPS